MKLTHDRAHNIAYLQIGPADRSVETRQLAEDLVADVGPDGEICGLEFLDANRQLGLVEAGRAGAGDALHLVVYQDAAAKFRLNVVAADGTVLLMAPTAFHTRSDAMDAARKLRAQGLLAPVKAAV